MQIIEDSDEDQLEITKDEINVTTESSNNITRFQCYLCANTKFTKGWMACENCSNWCCGKWVDNALKINEHFCINCKKIQNTFIPSFIRAKHAQNRDTMSKSYNKNQEKRQLNLKFQK